MKPRALFGLTRPFTLLAPAVGVVSNAFVAQAALPRGTMPWARVGAALAAALLVTAASNAWNQVYDLELDRVNKPYRALPAGLARPKEALALGHVCALLGLVLAYLVGATFFACVACGVFSTWIYSAPPLRTKRMTVGALLTIAIPRGLLVPVAGWAALAEPRTIEPWALGIVSFLFVLGAAVTKDFADVEGDEAYGCRTLPVVWGPRKAARFVAPFLVLPFLLYPLFGLVGWLQPGAGGLWLLAGALSITGAFAAAGLLRDAKGSSRTGGNRLPWILMYLMLLGSHVGCAVVYQVSL